jgi:hypothetical protein
MPTPTEPRLAVLHGLRLKGVAEAQGLAEVTGLHVDEVAATLADLAAAGLVSHRDGSFGGWSISPAGRTEHERLVAEELDDLGVRDAVHSAYRRFLALNPEMLATCTRWQLRADGSGEETLNDHSDPDYDAAVVAELVSLHEQVVPVLADLAALLPRFARYEPALAAALEAVRAGDGDMFTKPIVASYHTLWFELHEDLLASLSLDRSAEPHGTAGVTA